MRDYLSRFETIPDMLELDHLTVSGDVTFGKGVTLKVSGVAPDQMQYSTALSPPNSAILHIQNERPYIRVKVR